MTEFETFVTEQFKNMDNQFKNINDQLADFREQFTDINKQFKQFDFRLSRVEEYVETVAVGLPKVIDMLVPLLDDYNVRKGLFVK